MQVPVLLLALISLQDMNFKPILDTLPMHSYMRLLQCSSISFAPFTQVQLRFHTLVHTRGYFHPPSYILAVNLPCRVRLSLTLLYCYLLSLGCHSGLVPLKSSFPICIHRSDRGLYPLPWFARASYSRSEYVPKGSRLPLIQQRGFASVVASPLLPLFLCVIPGGSIRTVAKE